MKYFVLGLVEEKTKYKKTIYFIFKYYISKNGGIYNYYYFSLGIKKKKNFLNLFIKL